MTRYVVLFPISLQSGEMILPAADGDPPNVVEEEVIFQDPSELLSIEERATILKNMGVIVEANKREQLAAAKVKLAATEQAAEASLKTVTTKP